MNLLRKKKYKGEEVIDSENISIPFEIRNSKTNLNRYKCLDSKSKEVENKYIKELRDNEEFNKAPFSDRVVVIMPQYKRLSNHYEHTKETYIDMETGEKLPDGIMNIEIMRIVGFENCGQMIPCEGMTFKELLFEKIWGCSLTKETIKYFTSNDMKAQGYDGYREMPENREKRINGSYARGGIILTEIEGGYFIVTNGKHRVLMAMYAIFQKDGENGYLKKVKVISGRD